MTSIVVSNQLILSRLRTFLLVLAAFVSLGTIVELALTEHWDGPPQILPFVLCGLSFVAIMATLLRPKRSTIWLMRWIVGITFAGSLFGIFEHIEHNFEFALEIQPNAALNELIWSAVSGANPLLAPGILAFTALLTLAASYYHPALVEATE